MQMGHFLSKDGTSPRDDAATVPHYGSKMPSHNVGIDFAFIYPHFFEFCSEIVLLEVWWLFPAVVVHVVGEVKTFFYLNH